MTAYLFTWNPDIYRDLYEDYKKWLSGEKKSDNWSSGNNKSIPSGARFFLMRQSIEPKGIIAAGHTISGWRKMEHWDGKEKKKINANEIKFDQFSHPDTPLIQTKQLLKIDSNSAGLWFTPSSGVKIPDETARKLEAAWRIATGDTRARDEIFNPDELGIFDPNE